MNDQRSSYQQKHQQLICAKHAPNIYVSYCTTCMIPLCVECQDLHTDLHYKKNLPVQLKSIQRIHEETDKKLRDAIATYKRYIHMVETVTRNPVHYDKILEEIDIVHRNLLNDINRYFVGLKQTYDEYRRMSNFRQKQQDLYKRTEDLEGQLATLNHSRTIEAISIALSEKFQSNIDRDVHDIEQIVEKNKRDINQVIINEEYLQKILRYNIDRYVNNSRYLKSRDPSLHSLNKSMNLRTLNTEASINSYNSPEKGHYENKGNRASSLDRKPYSELKSELMGAGSGSKIAKNGLSTLLQNTGQTNKGKITGEGRYTNTSTGNPFYEGIPLQDKMGHPYLDYHNIDIRGRNLSHSISPNKRGAV